MQRILDQVLTILTELGDLEGDLIVLSTYFSSKQDPVRGGFQRRDDFSYIQHWYESVVKHRLKAVVFYDQLSEGFLKKYQTKHIRFVKCQLGKMSLNDERFFIFYEFIQKLPDNCFVLTTDINDVIINKNPFSLLDQNPNKLFVGRGDRRCWKNSTWTLKALYKLNKRYPQKLSISFFSYPVFNPGTLAGKKDKLEELLGHMTSEFKMLKDDGNYDMQVFNYVLKQYYYKTSSVWDRLVPFDWGYWFYYIQYRIMRRLEGKYRKHKYDLSQPEDAIFDNDIISTGSPFVSMFKWYEKEDDSKAYLIHK
ncbi:hypothetical protein [Echinicola salinicaeni]|uniref:hypothetical protein n=1 Tax=Echinicola salinicaeni TaxID=2762757 RepID=UPI001643FB68|nr:hypothetical protein [Echinicola salinicaeni]